MADFICCACKQAFPSLHGLHIHIARKEKVSLDDYYKLYFPRKDYLSGELIDFKNHEDYFSSFFSNKDNMAIWFQTNYTTQTAHELGKEIFKTRVSKKNLKYAPSQVELRTIAAPSIVTYQKMFDYNDFCRSIGLKTKFQYGISQNIKPLQDIKILIDTREQYPLNFKNFEVKKLDVGDYTAAEPNYSDVYVERKSVEDFYGTFFNEKNIERFSKEVARAQSYGFYLIVVVESTLTNCMGYKNFFIKEKNFVPLTFHTVRSLIQKFDNLQFVFTLNHYTAKNVTTRILNQGKEAVNYDWQYLIDTRQI